MKSALLIALLLIVGSGSFILGTRVGVTTFNQADAQFQASIAVAQLRLIERQRVADLAQWKEIELNSFLANHGRYMESQFKWLWPGLVPEDDRAIRSAVSYRASHPFEGVDLTKPTNWKAGVDMTSPFVRGVMSGQKENQELRRKVVSAYAP